MKSKHDWIEQASCHGVDTDIFMPDDHNEMNPENLEEALKFCAMCPVREECLNYAIEMGISIGIYGGLTYQERKAKHNQVVRPGPKKKPLVHGTYHGYSKHKCRCEGCREAAAAYYLRLRHEKLERKSA